MQARTGFFSFSFAEKLHEKWTSQKEGEKHININKQTNKKPTKKNPHTKKELFDITFCSILHFIFGFTCSHGWGFISITDLRKEQ